MTTKVTQTLENQIIKMKNNLKFAQNFEVVCQAQLKKESFSFNALIREMELFKEKIFNFGGLSFNLNDVKFFEEMFEICFGKKIYNENWIQVIKAMKYVLKHIESDDNDLIAHEIANEIFNKNK